MLQPQPAALAHRAFGIFLDKFLGEVELEDEAAKISGILADEMVAVMAGHFGNVPKVKKSSTLIERDGKLGMKGDHVVSLDPTATPTTM